MATPTTLPASFVSGAVLEAAQLNNLRGAFRVLQVVQSIKTDTFSTSSTTFTDVTGLTATITPSATSNKILIVAMVNYSTTSGSGGSPLVRISGGNATTFVGDAASNRVRTALFGVDVGSWAGSQTMSAGTIVYLDSPATTSATTYAVQMRQGTSGPVFINRSGVDSDTANYGRGASSITVMEISA